MYKTGIKCTRKITENAAHITNGAKNAEEMLERIKDLSVGLNDTYFQGFCYTQLTDVQQEVNGLFDADYNAKLDLKKLKEIFDAVK